MYESRKLSTGEMANRLGVSQPTVYNHLRRLNLSTGSLPRRYRAARKFEFTKEEKKRIIELREQGKYISEIALTLKRTIGPVRRIFNELGLKTGNLKPIAIGARFGYLTVVAAAAPQKTYKGHLESKSIVECHCGNRKEVFNYNLRSGNTKTCGCKIHLLRPDAAYIRILHGYRSGAAARGLEMNLTLAQIKYLVQMKCFYCHAVPSNSLKGRRRGRSSDETVLMYGGIDRVNSAGHYCPGNVLPACRMCNQAKSNASLGDFIAWLRRFGSDLDERKILQRAEKLGKILEKLA